MKTEFKTEKNEKRSHLVLKLYVSGMSPKSMEAIRNIQLICSENENQDMDLEIIDMYKHPVLAREQHIVFSPSLVRVYPEPRKMLIGTLSDTEKVKQALGLRME